MGEGAVVILCASLVNLILGRYLIARGRKISSIILVANGKHVLTDSWTSFGVVAGLLLVRWTGWLPLDPLLAIVIAGNVIWSGGCSSGNPSGGLWTRAIPPWGSASGPSSIGKPPRGPPFPRAPVPHQRKHGVGGVSPALQTRHVSCAGTCGFDRNRKGACRRPPNAGQDRHPPGADGKARRGPRRTAPTLTPARSPVSLAMRLRLTKALFSCYKLWKSNTHSPVRKDRS